MDGRGRWLPDAVVMRCWQKVSPTTAWTFLVTVILGLAVHMYAFTNDLINHDDIYHLLQCEYGAQSGRWFLPLVLSWDGSFSMPWLIGLLSVLCLALTACLTVSLLRIRGRLSGLVTAALLVAFPTVAATFSYMFTADAYFFGLFLAAFAAYAAARMPVMGLPLGACALILSLGIYQSYFPVAAVLMVGALLFDTLDGALSLKRLLLRGVKMVATLALAIFAYMAVARFVMRNAGGLTDYMGISEMGHLSLAELPALLIKCYSSYSGYFWNNGLGYFFGFVKPLIVVALLCAVALLLMLIVQTGMGVSRAVLALVLALLYPLAGDIIHVMVSGGAVHELMLYGTIYLLVLPLGLVSYAAERQADCGGSGHLGTSLLSWVIVISLALTAYSYAVADNKAYLKMEVSRDELTAYSNRLLSAVEQTPGYTPGMSLTLVGSSVVEPALTAQVPELGEINMVGVLDAGQLRAKYSYGEFLRYYMAYPGDVYMANSSDNDPEAKAQARATADLPEVQAMPNYPADGSIRIINGGVVVKLNPEPAPTE